MKKTIFTIGFVFLLASASWGQSIYQPGGGGSGGFTPAGTPERGDIIYGTGTGYSLLPHPAASNFVLVHGGHGADPAWSTSPSVSTLTAASANSITVGMDSAGSGPAIGSIIFHNATNTNHFSIISGTSGAALSWTLPTAAPAGNNYLLNTQTTGVLGYTDPATFQTPTGTPAGFVIASQAQGDLLYASSATAWARLGAASAGNVLISGGGAANPSWLAGFVLAGGTNTFSLTNGTASLDVAAGAAVDINYGFTVNTGAVTLTGPFTMAAPGAVNAVIASDGTNWTRLATSANVTTLLGSANYAAFLASLSGAPLASPTFTGKATTAASAAVAGAGVNFPHGVAPNTPANGDCWSTTAGLYCYINGATIGPYAIATTAAVLHIDDILTALGIASEATHFGTFTGTTIPDSSTAKEALQALETSLELKLPLAGGTMSGPLSLGPSYLSTTKTVGATGTTANKLCTIEAATGKVNTSPVSAVGILGIAITTRAGGSDLATEVLTRDIGSVVMDTGSTSVVGNIAIVGTTVAGTAKDSGFTDSTSIANNVQILGKFLTVASPGAAASIQFYGPGHYGALRSLASPGSYADSTLSGTPVVIEVTINGTPYYFKGYPAK